MVLADPTVVDKVLRSDEAKFHISGSVNRHNCVYWHESMPEQTVDLPLNSPGIMVWMGLTASGIVGPVFLEERVTGVLYLAKILNETVFPYLEENDRDEELIFQQDGAPPHYENVVRSALNEKLPGRWMRRRGSIEWPA